MHVEQVSPKNSSENQDNDKNVKGEENSNNLSEYPFPPRISLSTLLTHVAQDI